MKRRPPNALLFCARCGKATTRREADQRRFRTTLSACCAENLLAEPPKSPVPPLGVDKPDPPWVLNRPPWIAPQWERVI